MTTSLLVVPLLVTPAYDQLKCRYEIPDAKRRLSKVVAYLTRFRYAKHLIDIN